MKALLREDRREEPQAPPLSSAASRSIATVAVDMRMMRSSGIGTYVRNVVPRVLAGTDGIRGALLGDPSELRRLGSSATAGTTLHDCAAPIYSLREQIELLSSTPAGVDLFWSPHYNIPLLHRGKLLVTVHDVLHLAHPEYFRGPHRRLFARVMFQRVRRQAGAVICDSHFTADELVRLTGMNRCSIHVIHLGVGPEWFAASVGDAPHPRPYFLYVGNIKQHKNLDTLARAFGRIVHEVPQDLVIVGRRDGVMSGDGAIYTAAARLNGRLRFTGELTEQELRGYVGHAEALVLPSRYEGFGLPALEAMAAGCPVLVSRAASLPEVCGDAALYFDPNSDDQIGARMRLIASNRDLREELRLAGRDRARRFTWERCADQTREVLLGVLDR